MQTTLYPLDRDSESDDANLYEPTPPTAPAARQPTHYEFTPSPGSGSSMFSNRTQRRSQGTVLVPNSSRSASLSSSLQPPPCGQPPRRSTHNSPRTRYFPSSLGVEHHRRRSGESRSHSRELSGSPNISSTQGTDLSHDILWIQDGYTELRDTQVRLMEHVLHMTQRLDRLSSDFYQSQKPLLTQQLVGANMSVAGTPGDNAVLSVTNFHLHFPDFVTGLPADRPTEYDWKILWNYDDCTEEKDEVIFRVGNKGRPCMEKALRNEDGTLLTLEAYNRVKSTVRGVAAQLLALPPITAPGSKEAHTSRAKRYFTTTYPWEWANALGMIGYMEPVVRLCSAHWKADHLVSQHLRNINKQDDDEDGVRKRRRVASQSGQPSNVPQAKKPRSSAPATQDSETSFSASKPKPQQRIKAFTATSTSSVKLSSAESAKAPSAPSLAIACGASPALVSGRGATGPRDEEMDLLHGKKRFDVDLRNVDSSLDNLVDIITCNFYNDDSGYAETLDLLTSMQLAESFGRGASTPEVEFLIHRIETADPNDETNEDNLGAQWGHAQFANWRVPLTSWEAVGSPEIARRLLAAIIKTANVSRQLCKLNGELSQSTACLADCYLREAGQVLWDLWKKSGGPIVKGKEKADGATTSGATGNGILNMASGTSDTSGTGKSNLGGGTSASSTPTGNDGTLRGMDGSVNGGTGSGDVAPDDGDSSPRVANTSASSAAPEMSTSGSMPAACASGAGDCQMDPKFKATDFKKNDLVDFVTKHQLGPTRKAMTREQLMKVIVDRLQVAPAPDLQASFDNFIETRKQSKRQNTATKQKD